MQKQLTKVVAKGMLLSMAVSTVFLAPVSKQLVKAEEIQEIEAQQAQVQRELQSLDGDLVQVVSQIEDLQDQISEKQAGIAETEENIKVAQASADQQYQDMKARMRSMYEAGSSNSILTIIAESGSLADFVSRVEYSNQLYTYDRDLLGAYQATVSEIKDMKASLEQENEQLKSQQSELQAKETSLNTMISAKQGEASNLSAQLEEARALAARKAELERQRQAQEAAARLAQIQSANRVSNSGSSNRASNSNRNNNSSSSNSGSNSSSRNSGSNSSNAGTTKATYSGGNSIVAYASQFVGNPYVWGGTSLTNGIDCSGFVGQVMAHFGLLSQSAANSHGYTSGSLRSVGKAVAESDMQPGDIICYPGHVAIYAGGGVVVEAQNPQNGIRYGRPYKAYMGNVVAIRRLGV